MIGTTVGSYVITAKVSVGGMGTVYKAEHNLIGKQAAVKVLHPELRGNRDVVQRFFNEAKATTQIKHPGIVEVFDFGYLPSGDGYIVMEFLEGESLARRLKNTPVMDEGEAAFLMRGVCSALAAAHAKGIIHRDLKPDNIFLCPDPDSPIGERPKVLDFGIAKLNVGLTGPGNATKTGAVMGTPTYMSPEQCKGTGEVDARADLYSIGCMYYECVAGRPPFTDMGAGELIGAHLYVEPVKPSTCGATISAEAEQLIMSLLEKSPAKRPQTALDLGRAFAGLAQNFGLISRATAIRTPLDNRGGDAAITTPGHLGGLTPPSSTPAPVSPTPVPLTAVPTPAPAPTPLPVSHLEAVSATLPSSSSSQVSAVDVTLQPTTLSGAASQQVDVPRSRRGLFIGLGAALVILSGTALFFVARSKPAASPTPASSPAPAPAPVPPAPAPVTAPAPAPMPAPAPTTTPPPPATTPATTPTSPPQVKKPKPPVKPTDKTNAGSGSGSGILIETDI